MGERCPIYLNKNTVALINIYHRPDKLEDLWVADYQIYNESPEVIAENAARQFIDQLDKHWTPRFLKALRGEIDRALETKEADKWVDQTVSLVASY